MSNLKLQIEVTKHSRAVSFAGLFYMKKKKTFWGSEKKKKGEYFWLKLGLSKNKFHRVIAVNGIISVSSRDTYSQWWTLFTQCLSHVPREVHFQLVLSQVNKCVITQHPPSHSFPLSPSLLATPSFLLPYQQCPTTSHLSKQRFYCYYLVTLFSNYNFYTCDICTAIYPSAWN